MSKNINPLANIVGNEIEIGENCRIDAFVTITGKVKLGDNVHVGTGVCIFGRGGVTIGEQTSLSPGCKIFSSNEDADSGFLSNPTLECSYADVRHVDIGKRCVIGTNSVILPGVSIGDDVQVGCLSLVDRQLEPGYIYAGIPVHVLREKPQLTTV